MKQEAMQKHPEEWFFLHNFDVDRVFSTIRRTDYLVLFYICLLYTSPSPRD